MKTILANCFAVGRIGLSSPARAELDDVGLVRMLPPEQVEGKITAIFGQPWGKMNGQMAEFAKWKEAS